MGGREGAFIFFLWYDLFGGLEILIEDLAKTPEKFDRGSDFFLQFQKGTSDFSSEEGVFVKKSPMVLLLRKMASLIYVSNQFGAKVIQVLGTKDEIEP